MANRIAHRTVLIWCSAAVVLVVILLIVCYAFVSFSTADMVYSVSTAPKARVGLVLGTSRRTTKRTLNGYYTARMQTAAELYAAGKVQYLLVSGDNGTLEYNEPDSMQKDLVALGVPASHIALDFAGFDTFDSMIRAQKVWGLDTMLVVSQDFHVRRALYIAKCKGIVAAGVVAPDPHYSVLSMIRLREMFARIKLLADVHILNSTPRFLGPHEFFPADTIHTTQPTVDEALHSHDG